MNQCCCYFIILIKRLIKIPRIHLTALELGHLIRSSHCFNCSTLHFRNCSVRHLPGARFRAPPSSLADPRPRRDRLADNFIFPVKGDMHNFAPAGPCLQGGAVNCFFGSCLFCSWPSCLPFATGLLAVLCGRATMLLRLIRAFLTPLSAGPYTLYTCVFVLSKLWLKLIKFIELNCFKLTRYSFSSIFILCLNISCYSCSASIIIFSRSRYSLILS